MLAEWHKNKQTNKRVINEEREHARQANEGKREEVHKIRIKTKK